MFKTIKIIIGFLIVICLAALTFFIWPKQTAEIVVENINTITDNIEENFLSTHLPKVEEKSIKILFFGDMMLDRHVAEQMQAKDSLNYILGKLDEKNFFKNYDLISANLEGAVTNDGGHYAPHVEYDFAFSPYIINWLKEYNFNFFNLANNHLLDQGKQGIIETRNNLNELGFNYSGCYDGQVGECSSTIIKIADKKIGLAGFSMVYSKLDTSEVKKIIENLATTTNFIIINIHWGVEYEHNYRKIQQETAYQLIDSGADLIIGHHPHVVQGMEMYSPRGEAGQNKPIFYSLGNFIFDQYFSKDTQESLALVLEWNENKIKYTLYALKSNLSQVELMEGEEKEKFLEKFISWSSLDKEIGEQIKQGEFELKK